MKTLIFLIAVLMTGEAWAQLSKSSVFHHQKNQLGTFEDWQRHARSAIVLMQASCLDQHHFRSSVVAIRIQPEEMNKKSFLQFLDQDCVLGIESDHVVRSEAKINDPLFERQRYLSSMNFSAGHLVYQSPVWGALPQVLVAVIDSGIDLQHPEFLGKLWIGGDGRIGHNFLAPETSAQDDFGHGTHVSGLIAASLGNGMGGVGISPQSQLMVLKTQDSNGEGSVADLINAIRFAVDHGAQVINISLSIAANSPGILDAVEYALERNIIVVAASGNAAQEITAQNFIAPAGYALHRPGMISVGSFDAETGALSWFSNYSTSYVKIAAPGSDGSQRIWSTSLGSGYRGLEGTSMAAPMVTASVAQIISSVRSAGRSVQVSEIEQILFRGARTNSLMNGKVGGSRQLNHFGSGRVVVTELLTTTGGFDD